MVSKRGADEVRLCPRGGPRIALLLFAIDTPPTGFGGRPQLFLPGDEGEVERRGGVAPIAQGKADTSGELGKRPRFILGVTGGAGIAPAMEEALDAGRGADGEDILGPGEGPEGLSGKRRCNGIEAGDAAESCL